MMQRPSAPTHAISILRRPPLMLALSLLVFPALNAGLNLVIVHTSLPLFMDSIFTATGAALFGILPGIATAILTNLLAEAFSGFPWIHLPFAVCGAATAFIVGRSARRGGFDTPTGGAAAMLGITFTNSLLGAVIAVFVFGGMTGVNIDVIVSGFAMALDDIFSAAFLARLPANLVDKTVAVAFAWFVHAALVRDPSASKPTAKRGSSEDWSPPGD